MVVEAQAAFTPLLPKELLTEFYADPDVRLCGAGNPHGRGRRVAGDVRVSGRWPYASGSGLQRFWHDLHVGSRHVQLTTHLAAERHGDALAMPAQVPTGAENVRR
ncbi:hypothetical protein ACFQHV_03795 [Promicromonospora thailandica]|uniref:Uncharacterized protein n=1 Tax=Promicromonospora thailandica TaxID=765201 RepID=A0A9X2JVI5_9MICO|nr:hypothetical protein [Promicromonospora thailandica]MCP2265650.1 hypothetical protein [Promicromonospora thailandica]BFF21657.1 hypothetical protein GCM10025730_51780 [Promicromonospora thailandica]